MSRAENVQRSVYITIMNSPAITAFPFSYSKPCDTFRPRVGQTAATRTGLGGKRFIHFFNGCPVRNRFIAEHVSEGRPGRVVDAFAHPGLGQALGIHITNGDVIELLYKARRQPVQEVGASALDLGVQFCRLAPLSGALRLGKLRLKLTEVPRIIYLLASR